MLNTSRISCSFANVAEEGQKCQVLTLNEKEIEIGDLATLFTTHIGQHLHNAVFQMHLLLLWHVVPLKPGYTTYRPSVYSLTQKYFLLRFIRKVKLTL